MKHLVRRTPSERAKHVEAFKSGSLSLIEYSRLCGISVSVLRYWVLSEKKKPKDSRGTLGSFVPVQMEDNPIPCCEMIIEFPQGIRVTLKGKVEASYLRSLLG